MYTYGRNQKRECNVITLQKLEYLSLNYSAYYTHTMQKYECYYTKLQTVPHIITLDYRLTNTHTCNTHKISKLHTNPTH